MTDRNTGLAIDGFDPVAYFTEGEALVGRAEIEFSWGGAVWRFRNDGNRAAFAQNPEIYAPRYGGYDPLGLARGVARPGNPLLWKIAGERLYLFYSPEAAAEFAAGSEAVIGAADSRWPDVLRKLPR